MLNPELNNIGREPHIRDVSKNVAEMMRQALSEKSNDAHCFALLLDHLMKYPSKLKKWGKEE